MNTLPRQVEPAEDQADRYYDYSPRLIGGLIAAYVLAWLSISAGYALLEGLAILLLFAVAAATVALDGTAVLTLRGRISRKRPPGCVAIGIALMFFPLFFFWLIPYLAIAARDTHAARSRRALERQQRIAELEAKLGLLPSAAGPCPTCGKPLQAGAEFCAYCGERVATPLRLCPQCGTRTFPDASWCPSCGAPLPPPGIGA
ncbi:MAG: zinc ribbon domain-containing protein [Sphaerobacter sp.]|nr:zinc ribbon domain-containing protein [Sphaerobacter sp.]